MHLVIPHVGKSHLTYRLLDSIPDEHRIVLVDGSYVQDMGTRAHAMRGRLTYLPTGGTPHCLARNWNLGAAAVPASEPGWLFCANDVELQPVAWRYLAEELRLYPDCGIIRDRDTKWNVWYVRRWAWDLLAPMDEAYKPCAGEDDDLVMKCDATGIRVRVANLGVTPLEGGHGSRVDMHRPGVDSDPSVRSRVLQHFQRKWGIAPSARSDQRYREAKARVLVGGRRRAEVPPPSEQFPRPTERGMYGTLPPMWPDPLRLHLGCGRRKLEGFLNVDANESYTPDYLLDVERDPWPWGEATVDRIETYHMIEHLSRAGGRAFLESCARVLRPGGTLVIECPDLAAAAAAVANGGGPRARMSIFGSQMGPWLFHRWGYTEGMLRTLSRDVGLEPTHVGPGTDAHQDDEPCLRLEAVKPGRPQMALEDPAAMYHP